MAEALGRDSRFMAAPGLDDAERRRLRGAIDARLEINVVLRNLRKDGELFWNELTITPVRDERGEVSHFIGLVNDVTALKQRTAHLEHEVNHDPLTGLANRNLLWDRLEQALQAAQRNKSLVATILLDLNKFKCINDTMGHEVGDEVLRVVAKRLQASVRGTDTVARLSGDEFVLVLADQPSLRNPHLNKPVLDQIRQLGPSLAIDDFGAGLSNLRYLQELPMQHLKIARSSVGGICPVTNSGDLVRTLIGIGRSLHLPVVAEGVESLSQRNFLRQNGCDEIQGNLFHEPMSEADLRQLLDAD
ncbi:hypothetical protein CSQ96_24110 [Janthinobacterium sp. BJB412]|nr:hypothetical protein CSQ96_24110 [Janthinobacterium sp. BJB412]